VRRARLESRFLGGQVVLPPPGPPGRPLPRRWQPRRRDSGGVDHWLRRDRLPRVVAGPSSTTQAFRQGLRERGSVEGQKIVIEYRWTGGEAEGLLGLAEDLVRSGPDI